MPKKGHSEEEILRVLHQVDAGEKVAEVCRKAGVSEGTFYQLLTPNLSRIIGDHRL